MIVYITIYLGVAKSSGVTFQFFQIRNSNVSYETKSLAANQNTIRSKCRKVLWATVGRLIHNIDSSPRLRFELVVHDEIYFQFLNESYLNAAKAIHKQLLC